MIYAICVAVIVIILFLIILALYNQKRRIEMYNVKFEDSINSIDLLQETEIDNLTKLSKLIKTKKDDKLFKDLKKVKDKEIDTFEIDEYLSQTNKELKDYLEYNKVEYTDEFMKIIHDYKRVRVESLALKEYYNYNVEEYNKYIKKITHLVTKIFKKAKIKEAFEIKKEIEFEILKAKDSSK